MKLERWDDALSADMGERGWIGMTWPTAFGALTGGGEGHSIIG